MSKHIKTSLDEFNKLNEVREIFTSLYHGTDLASALNIEKKGVSIKQSSGGYFGWGFYTTPDYKLAKSNYADFSDGDEGGAILEFKLKDTANILDLRDEKDWDIWIKYSRQVSNPEFYKTVTNDGIDGLWDNSFEGVVIYNPKVLELIKIHKI